MPGCVPACPAAVISGVLRGSISGSGGGGSSGTGSELPPTEAVSGFSFIVFPVSMPIVSGSFAGTIPFCTASLPSSPAEKSFPGSPTPGSGSRFFAISWSNRARAISSRSCCCDDGSRNGSSGCQYRCSSPNGSSCARNCSAVSAYGFGAPTLYSTSMSCGGTDADNKLSIRGFPDLFPCISGTVDVPVPPPRSSVRLFG
mmetsp:Transcript_6983/g.16965  ORF Transcript_6983/g.16965 Transcript_6983/m.16965 type:complete len:200 (+) Transcript_6983:286-885(+)